MMIYDGQMLQLTPWLLLCRGGREHPLQWEHAHTLQWEHAHTLQWEHAHTLQWEHAHTV